MPEAHSTVSGTAATAGPAPPSTCARELWRLRLGVVQFAGECLVRAFAWCWAGLGWGGAGVPGAEWGGCWQILVETHVGASAIRARTGCLGHCRADVQGSPLGIAALTAATREGGHAQPPNAAAAVAAAPPKMRRTHLVCLLECLPGVVAAEVAHQRLLGQEAVGKPTPGERRGGAKRGGGEKKGWPHFGGGRGPGGEELPP